MREKDMRERVERFLQAYRRRALASLLGIGIGAAGCARAERPPKAAAEGSSTRDSSRRQLDAGAVAPDAEHYKNVRAIYSAPHKRYAPDAEHYKNVRAIYSAPHKR